MVMIVFTSFSQKVLYHPSDIENLILGFLDCLDLSTCTNTKLELNSVQFGRLNSSLGPKLCCDAPN